MRHHRVFAIAECTALGRVVPSTPAIAIRATAGLLAALVTAGVVWSAVTSADLVVRAPARIRPRNAPQLSFATSSGERVLAQTGGRVAQVLVKEGQRVAVGAKLAVLDTRAAENDVARLDAAVTSGRDTRDATKRMQELALAQFQAAQYTREADLAQVARDEARGRSRRETDITLAKTALEAAQREDARMRALEADGAASPAQAEQATAKVAEARARLDAAMVAAAGGRTEVLRRQIAQAERDFAVHREELAQQLAREDGDLAAAIGRADNAKLELAKATVVADRAGVVGTVSVLPGEVVQPAQNLFTISPEAGLRVDAAVSVGEIGRLKPGMRARIRIDAFDWQRYGIVTGTISQISPDAEALANGGGLVYTVRVELDREDVGRGDLHGQLKLGMTGMVEVITGHEHLLPLLLGRLHQAISLGG